ncbi:MAG: class I SAM-dependent methyltransferase, partial [Nanoarchaeota archaeon]
IFPMNQQWNEVYKKEGKVFKKLQSNIPEIAAIFRKNNIRKILDLGCGYGRHVIYFAKRGFDVSGIDISKEGIKITNSWLKKENLKADLKIGDIYKKLPYPDNSFDAVIATGVIDHNEIQNIRKMILELRRVLRPNGLIFIVTAKRKFKSKNQIIILKFVDQRTRCKFIAPRTCVPLEGEQKGLIHYSFNKESLKKEFKNFENNIWLSSNKRHYLLLGKLKS